MNPKHAALAFSPGSDFRTVVLFESVRLANCMADRVAGFGG